jgi:hypothetical protein
MYNSKSVRRNGSLIVIISLVQKIKSFTVDTLFTNTSAMLIVKPRLTESVGQEQTIPALRDEILTFHLSRFTIESAIVSLTYHWLSNWLIPYLISALSFPAGLPR